MKHQELQNHIQGSFLMGHYLEAFLVQSAYIESLLKLYADFNFFIKVVTENGEFVKSGEKAELSLIRALNQRLGKFNLLELTEFLFDSKLIDQRQKKALDDYRKQRNRVLHDLFKQMSKDDFEKELKMVCEQGNALIFSEEFKKVASLVEEMESKNLWGVSSPS